MAVTKPNPIPDASVAIVDPQTGKMTTFWYQFFSTLLLYIRPVPVTVAGLPSASAAGAGARGFVTDATATTFHNTVAGGGANKVPVVSDGTNWLIG